MVNDRIPTIESVLIAPVLPEPADTRAIGYLADEGRVQARENVWLVALTLDAVPEPAGRMLALHLGDHRIEKYWGFERGIYFKVIDPDFFRLHEGKEFLFVADDGRTSRTGQFFTVTRDRVGEASEAPDAVEQLPTQRELLDRLRDG